MAKKIKVKPSRAESVISVIMGVVFVFIGIFVAIPNAGLFGIFWTFMAAVITFANFINAFSEEGIASHEIIIDDEVLDSVDIEEKLKKLESLYNQRLITRDEYEEKRKQILDEF